MKCHVCDEELQVDDPVVRRGYWSPDGLVAQPSQLDPATLALVDLTEEEFREHATLEYLHGGCLAAIFKILGGEQ